MYAFKENVFQAEILLNVTRYLYNQLSTPLLLSIMILLLLILWLLGSSLFCSQRDVSFNHGHHLMRTQTLKHRCHKQQRGLTVLYNHRNSPMPYVPHKSLSFPSASLKAFSKCQTNIAQFPVCRLSTPSLCLTTGPVLTENQLRSGGLIGCVRRLQAHLQS